MPGLVPFLGEKSHVQCEDLGTQVAFVRLRQQKCPRVDISGPGDPGGISSMATAAEIPRVGIMRPEWTSVSRVQEAQCQGWYISLRQGRRKEGRGDAAELVSTSPTRVFACGAQSAERLQSSILPAEEEADAQRGRHSGCPRSCHSILTSITLVSWGQGKGQGTRGAVALTTLRVVWEGVPWAGCDFPGNPRPTLQAKRAWPGTQPSQRPACVGVTHVPETSELSPRWHFRSLQRLSAGR